MAEKSLAEKLKQIDKISEGINKRANKVIAGRLSENQDLVDKLTLKVIETPSQNINNALGGGFPRGKMTIVAGLADSGKTSLLLETIGKNMQKDPNFVCGWLESENSLDINYLTQTFGIDPARFVYVEHDRNGAAESALNTVESIIAAQVCDMVCINSLKCLVPSEEFNKGFEGQSIGLQARMNAKMTRRFTSIVAESNAAFVVVTHLSTQIGSMSRDPLILSGGLALMYAASIIVDLRKRSLQETDPIAKEDGIKIGMAVKKNHAVPNRNPYVKTDYYAIFGKGIEIYLEALENALNQQILFKSGPFIRDVDPETGDPKVLEDGTKLQWQGREAFRKYCINNPEYFNQLLKRISGQIIHMSEEEIIEIQAEEDEMYKDIDTELVEDKKKKKK